MKGQTNAMMHRNVFLPVLGIAVAAGALMFLCLYLVWRQREVFSRRMDRYQVRPSQVSGGLYIAGGLVMILTVGGLPLNVIAPQVLYGFGAAFAIATGIDRFLNPPPQEFRPPWYVGVGDPSWLTLSDAARARKFTFRLSWVGTAVLVLCVALASFSLKSKNQREQNQRHADAVSEIERWGGTVQQNRVTLAGTDITDADLTVLFQLDDVKELNLGGTQITNDGLRLVGQQHQLFKLNLSGTQVDDDGLVHLAELRNLGELRLRKTEVTGRGFPVRSTPNCRMILDLSLCPITQQGLQNISKVSKLLHVDLNETDIDDSMLDELTKIETGSLDITNTNVSLEGSAQIQTAKPTLSLFWSKK